MAKGSQNPELISILYAGTVAVCILCERRGWNYDVWRTMDLRDLAEIDHISRQMFPDDIQREAALDVSWEHVYDLHTDHWNAIETLATNLATLEWMTGAEAHTIIRQAIGEKNDDWRLDMLKSEHYSLLYHLTLSLPRFCGSSAALVLSSGICRS